MKFLNFHQSFSTRASLRIIAVAGLAFAATFGATFHYSRRTIRNESISLAQLQLKDATGQIQSIMRRVSMTVDNVRDAAQRGWLPADTLYEVVRGLVANNDEIVGSAIAFEPHHYPQKGHFFSPYACVADSGVAVMQLGTPTYDYFGMEWYTAPKEQGRGYWTRPYYDSEGAEDLICTYSAPMRGPGGEFIGVVTADISLVWLNRITQSVKPYPATYSFVVDRDGTYIAHRDRARISHRAVLQAQDPQVREAGRRMVAGETGWAEIESYGRPSYLFFAPVGTAGWSVAMVNSVDDVFAGLVATSRWLAAAVLAGLALLFAVCWWVIRQLALPLRAFASSAKEIARGDFDTPLPEIRHRDEMGDLRDALSYMQRELASYIDRLGLTTAAKEKIESELRIARDIQMDMVPKIFPPFPERADVDLCATLRPAKEVGGDLYDFFIDRGRLYFAIGDVSGKGVPASLMMAVTRSLFRSVAAQLRDPAAITNSINRAIADTNEHNMFVTLFVGVLDLATGRMSYCNAGHNPPCLKGPGSEARFMTMNRNLPVGVLPDFEYKTQEENLQAGQILFLYTDGLTEAENASQELYGERRLVQALVRCPSREARVVIDHMAQAVADHVGQAAQSDDLAMMAVCYYGAAPAPASGGSAGSAAPFATLMASAASRVKFGASTAPAPQAAPEAEPPRWKLSVKSRVADIALLEEFVRRVAHDTGLPSAEAASVNLGLEEALANVVTHAFPKGEEWHRIELAVREEPGALVFALRDQGSPFDPTAVAAPDITLGVEEREIGGLGIFMLRKVMTSVEYRREGDFNVLTMRKEINKNTEKQ